MGRFLGVDRLSQSFARVSPYVYALDRPLLLVDPDGDSARVVTDRKSGTITFINDGKSQIKKESGEIAKDQPSSASFQVRTAVVQGSEEIKGDETGKYADDLKPLKIKKHDAYGPGKLTYIDTGRRDGKDIHGGGTGLPDPHKDQQGWVPTKGCQRMQNGDVRRLSRLIVDYKKAHPAEKVPGFIK